ncbi:MAG: tetratricopeptide repeat protein, partial [Planctomycetota bacterium]
MRGAQFWNPLEREADQVYITNVDCYRNITRHLASCGAKVFLIMFLAALFTLPAFAQEDLWEELNDKATQLLQERRYADAIKVSEEAIKVATNTFTPNHPCIAISKNLLGTLYWTYGRFSEAEPLFKQALAIYEEGLGPDHPKVATVLQNLADMYL